MKCNFNNVSLQMTAGGPSQFPASDLPQIALSGRSNVGKSSLINTLLGRKSFARVSSSPGKTITVNFYNIDNSFFLVDLPGYGYARRSASDIKKWSTLTDGYFTSNPRRGNIKAVVQLFDIRIGPTDDDLSMIDYLSQTDTPFILVGTKSDKLSKTAVANSISQLKERFANSGCSDIIAFSSHNGEGKQALLDRIISMIEA